MLPINYFQEQMDIIRREALVTARNKIFFGQRTLTTRDLLYEHGYYHLECDLKTLPWAKSTAGTFNVQENALRIIQAELHEGLSDAVLTREIILIDSIDLGLPKLATLDYSYSSSKRSRRNTTLQDPAYTHEQLVAAGRAIGLKPLEFHSQLIYQFMLTFASDSEQWMSFASKIVSVVDQTDQALTVSIPLWPTSPKPYISISTRSFFFGAELNIRDRFAFEYA